MIENTGGPAFPSTMHERIRWPGGTRPGGLSETSDPYQVSYPGMTLRDYFAGQALIGWLSTYSHSQGKEANMVEAEAYAKSAYELADALLKERNK
jgi:hypothetical protein